MIYNFICGITRTAYHLFDLSFLQPAIGTFVHGLFIVHRSNFLLIYLLF